MPASAERCARLIPAISAALFTRLRSSNTSWSTGELDSRLAQPLGGREREVVRNNGRVDAEGGTGVDVDLAPDLVDRKPARDQLVVTELLEGMGLEATDTGDAIDLDRQ